MTKVFNLFLFIYLVFSGQYGDYSKTLTLSFTGDIMAHNVNYQMEDYSLIYEEVQHIFQNDDLSFGNLEFPIVPSSPQSSYPSFNVHPAYVEAAINAGLDVFSLSNNHTFDKGLDGVIQTFNTVNLMQERAERDIYFAGIKIDPEADFEPITIMSKGYKIGFIAITQFMNAPFYRENVLMINYNNTEDVKYGLDLISEVSENYDLFIVSYHGGVEYSLSPNPAKKEFFHDLLKAGAHIIYGHHPHVPQPYELVNVNGLNRVILYSTGNFISGQGYIIDPSMPEDYWSYTGDSVVYILKTEFTENGPTVTEVEPYLIGNYTTERKDVVVEPLINLATKELPGLWSEFYEIRYRILSKFMEDNRIYTVIEEELDVSAEEIVVEEILEEEISAEEVAVEEIPLVE